MVGICVSDLQEKILKPLFDAGISPEEIDQIAPRLMVDPEYLKKELEFEIRKEVEAKYKHEYELDTVDDFTPEFYIESDLTIELGKGEYKKEIRIREANADDFDRLISQVPDIAKHVYNSSSADVFKGKDLWRTVLEVLEFGFKDSRNGKPTKFKVWLYEEIARLLSNPQTNQIITARYLLSCHPSQLINAIKTFYKANTDFFAELSGEIPSDITTLISTLTGKIISMTQKVKEMTPQLTQAFNSVGTTINGGLTTLSGQLSENLDLELTGDSLPSPNSGDSELPKDTEVSLMDTTIGDTSKTMEMEVVV